MLTDNIFIFHFFCYVKSNEEFTEAFLKSKFEIFGRIEAIEILKHGKDEAYVTFTDDHSAYLAMRTNDDSIKRGKQIFSMQPADSWVQPSSLGTLDSNDVNPPLIFILNDDCLRKIFGYLNLRSLLRVAETCERFEDLVKPFFHRYKKFNALNTDSTHPLSMYEFRLHLKYLGPHLRVIKVHWDLKFKRQQLHRMIVKMGQYLRSDTLREMYLNDVILNDKEFDIIKPLRRNLKQFGMQLYNTSFECLSPNELKELPMNINEGHSFWSKIQEIIFNRNMGSESCYYFEFCLRKCAPFEGFTFNASYPHQQIPKIVRISPKMKRLVIVSKHPECMTRSVLEPIRELHHLETLCLLRIDKKTILDVFQFLPQVPWIKTVVIQTKGGFDANESSRTALLVGSEFVNLAKRLKSLEKLVIQYIPINKISIISFVGMSKTLKQLHFHRGQTDFDDYFINNLGFVRKNLMRGKKDKLQLFFDEKIIQNNFSASPIENDFKDFIELSHKCDCNSWYDAV